MSLYIFFLTHGWDLKYGYCFLEIVSFLLISATPIMKGTQLRERGRTAHDFKST